jgi:hypothetical protein
LTNFRIIALTGRFRRTRFVETLPDVKEVVDWAGNKIKSMTFADFVEAAKLIDMNEWMKEIKQLKDDWLDDSIDYYDAVDTAASLLTDWDDLGIVLATAAQFFEEDIAGGEARSKALDWLLNDGDCLVGLASPWIQGMCAAFAPNLSEKDDTLDISTYGFLPLLDVLEEQEAMTNLKPEFVTSVLTQLVQQRGKRQRVKQTLLRRTPQWQNVFASDDSNRIFSFREHAILAAASVPPKQIISRFVSEHYECLVKIPVHKGDGDFISFIFFDTKNTDDACTGQKLQFCGIDTEIDEKGFAQICMNDDTIGCLETFLLLGGDLSLEVDNKRWITEKSGESK